MTRVLTALLLCLAATGCPRETQDPEPGEGTPCTTMAQCNMGATCSEAPLFACVDGLCEASPSVIRPCAGGSAAPDAGM